MLKGYPITLICSKVFDVNDYRNIAVEYSVELDVERFDPVFFASISGYNKLMLNVDFYRRFSSDKFILIYQTDCFVFKDELEQWCDKNYDYVGAPWPFDTGIWIGHHYPWLARKYYRTIGKNRVPNVGNGGLSLRKVSSFIKNLSLFRYSVKNWDHNEDTFISHCLPIFNPFFSIPSVKQASLFSLDTSPEMYYQLNNHTLPFGCHGWFRDANEYEGNKGFYIPIIKSFGYDINDINSIDNSVA
ncbi:DUF5672 family protein [Arcticibacter sp.]|uniref:DUF5672 family protein n=1 Tax=Arcticibacter sp. TaxID=1872630 RepID=UPI00388F19EF